MIRCGPSRRAPEPFQLDNCSCYELVLLNMIWEVFACFACYDRRVTARSSIIRCFIQTRLTTIRMQSNKMKHPSRLIMEIANLTNNEHNKQHSQQQFNNEHLIYYCAHVLYFVCTLLCSDYGIANALGTHRHVSMTLSRK